MTTAAVEEKDDEVTEIVLTIEVVEATRYVAWRMIPGRKEERQQQQCEKFVNLSTFV